MESRNVTRVSLPSLECETRRPAGAGLKECEIRESGRFATREATRGVEEFNTRRTFGDEVQPTVCGGSPCSSWYFRISSVNPSDATWPEYF